MDGEGCEPESEASGGSRQPENLLLSRAHTGFGCCGGVKSIAPICRILRMSTCFSVYSSVYPFFFFFMESFGG